MTPVGAARPIPIDVQIIAATNRDLEAEVQGGHFREDLFFRLNMVELKVPPLRECVEDIPSLIRFFAQRFAERYERDVWEPDPESLRQFCSYAWPGNIRQLSHVIEQSYVLDCAPALPHQERAPLLQDRLPYFDLARLRSAAVRQALRATDGHKGRAAKLLGVHANTLTRMLAEIKVEDQDCARGPVGIAPRNSASSTYCVDHPLSNRRFAIPSSLLHARGSLIPARPLFLPLVLRWACPFLRRSEIGLITL